MRSVFAVIIGIAVCAVSYLPVRGADSKKACYKKCHTMIYKDCMRELKETKSEVMSQSNMKKVCKEACDECKKDCDTGKSPRSKYSE